MASSSEIQIKVVPNSSRDQIAGQVGDAIKVKVTAPPEAGKANAAACKLIAKALGIAPKQVTVVAGQSNPNKRISINGLDEAAVRAKLIDRH